MTTQKLALYKTQRLDDTPAGGGQMTNVVVPDNQANNLFGPISRVNRANGNVSLRKAIVKALPPTTQTFFGAHFIIAGPPSNEDVSAIALDTGSWTDTRTQAIDRIESYLVQGPQTRLWAYGQQVQGQRAIIVYQPPGLALPNIGETYVLVNRSVTPNVTQFVRVTTIKNEVQQFLDAAGPFYLNIITLGISAPLLTTFPGAEAQRLSTPLAPSLLCTTNVADATKYYGVMTPAADIASGAESANMATVFGQLLPSTLDEGDITAAEPLGTYSMIASGPATSVTFTDYASTSLFVGNKFYAPTGIYPGSITINRDGNTWNYVDDGDGNIRTPAGSIIATVDYAAGAFVVTSAPGGTWSNNNITIAFTPATQVSQSGYTKQQSVTESTRGFVYVDVLDPLPAPSTCVVSYRSNGRWYDLTDDGTGTLVGASGAGTGTLRFDGGNLVVTLGALPDIFSNVVITWGQASQYNIRTTDADIQIPAVSLTLSQPCKPGTISLTWLVGSTTKTITDGAGAGVLSGDGTGTIVYGASILTFRPTSLPNPVTGFSVAYQTNPQTVQHLTPSKSGSDLILTLSNAPIAPKSVHISYDLLAPQAYPHLFGGNPNIGRRIHDDGSGGLVDSLYGAIAGSSLDYTTGIATFNPDLAAGVYTTPIYANSIYEYWEGSPPILKTLNLPYVTGWNQTTATAAFVNGSAVTVASTNASATSAAQTDNFSVPGIQIDLTPKTVEPIVPGSVMFTYAGDTYVDRGGLLYRSISKKTNAGVAAGSLDYTTGKGIITDWTAGGAQSLSIKALLGEYGVNPISYLASRVPGQSVRPASFIIQANRKSDGTLITATADVNGDFSTADMKGHIESATGFYTVAFGQNVLDSSLTSDQKAEAWYNAANIDGTGHIWKPDEALASSVNYSCVVDTYLALSASVLGIDPVRLPQDGRVLIARAGDTLVFRNPLLFTFGGSVIAGDVVSLPRGGLESAVLYDDDGKLLDIGLYTADLVAGSITMANPLDLTGYTQPLVCRHTRGELRLCTDAQITGRLDWSPPLDNAYPAASSFVSSAFIAENAGNLQAHYDTLFEQTTWNFNPNQLFADSFQGSAPASSYDDVDFPIQVLDRDAITQRIMLHFTSPTGGDVIFEELGVRATFSTAQDVMPINPATSGETTTTTAGFTIAAAGITQAVPFTAVADFELTDYVTIVAGSNSINGVITAINTGTLVATVRTVSITTGAAGNTMASGAVVTVQNPYFFLDHRGFGSGWATGNAIRFNITGAGFPVWIARSVQVGAAETLDDSFLTEVRWDE